MTNSSILLEDRVKKTEINELIKGFKYVGLKKENNHIPTPEYQCTKIGCPSYLIKFSAPEMYNHVLKEH